MVSLAPHSSSRTEGAVDQEIRLSRGPLISDPPIHAELQLSNFHISRRPRPLPKEIVLKPDLPFAQNHFLWVLGALSFLVTMSAFGYAWSTTSAHNWVSRVIWGNPQNTIFTINLLSHLTGLFLDGLITRAFDNLRWRLCCRSQGIKLLDFMALAGSTSFLGLIRVLFGVGTRKRKSNNGIVKVLRRNSYRLWSALRYLFR